MFFNISKFGPQLSHIIKCTGHNDYKSMKPYIDIVDEIKASEMNKMNFMY